MSYKKGSATVKTDRRYQVTIKELSNLTGLNFGKKLFDANLEAYDQITMGCSGVPLGLVKRADGDARKAIELLDAKFARTSKANLTQTLAEFTNCKLADGERDPDEWFLELDEIKDHLAMIDQTYDLQ